MKELFIGLLVLLSLVVLSVLGAILLPFIVLTSVFLQWVVFVVFVIAGIWLVGKVTLWAIERSRKDKVEILDEDDYKRRKLR